MKKIKNHKGKIVLIIGAVLLCAVAFYAGRLSLLAEEETPISEIDLPEKQKVSLAMSKFEDGVQGKIEGDATLKINNQVIDQTDFSAVTGATLSVYNDSFEFTTPLIVAEECVDPDKIGVPPDAQYVASKNGTKYHPIDSGTANRIKDENKVYFQTKEEAEKAGYEAGKSVK